MDWGTLFSYTPNIRTVISQLFWKLNSGWSYLSQFKEGFPPSQVLGCSWRRRQSLMLPLAIGFSNLWGMSSEMSLE